MPTRSRPLLALASLAAAGLLLAGRALVPTESDEAGAAAITVQVGQENGGSANAKQFNPASITVAAGDTVHWERFSGTHNVTSYSETAPGNPEWQSQRLDQAGESFDGAFPAPGLFTYYCSIHASRSDADPATIDAEIAAGSMVGKIVVQAAPTATPTLTPTPTPKSSATPTATSTPSACQRADFDNDGTVDLVDVVLLASHFNATAGEPAYDAEFDLNGDGLVDLVDVVLLAAFFNQSCI